MRQVGRFAGYRIAGLVGSAITHPRPLQDRFWLPLFFRSPYLTYQGVANIVGSRDATRLAFQSGLIADGETWMGMIRSRNQSSHTYNLEQAQAIVREVIDRFYSAFCALNDTFAALADASR